MYQTLSALATGLLLGQAPQTTTVDAEVAQPACKHCAAAATSSGWTTVSTQTRTWSQTGTWTPATGWTWHNTVETSGNQRGDNRTVLSRVSDRLSGIFGSRQPNNPQPMQTQSWSTGWHEDGDAALPIISSQSPVGHVTTEEPPLLEATAALPKAETPRQSDGIKAAAFTPTPPVTNPATIRPALLSKLGHAEDYSWIIGQIEITSGARVVHYAAPAGHDHFGGQMILNGEVDLSPFTSGDLVMVHGSVIPGRGGNLYRVKAISAIDPTR